MASIRQLSDKVGVARKRLKMKQESLADILGCSRSYISKLEGGRVIPSGTFAEKLERALSLRANALVAIIRAIRFNEALLKRQAVEHARNGDARNGNGCAHCDGKKRHYNKK